MTEKKKLLDRVTGLTQTIAKPLTTFANIPAVQAIQQGLIGMTPIIVIGSIFITLYTLGSPSIGESGKALLPFLEPLANAFIDFHSVAIVILGIYASISIAMAYAKILKVDQVNCVMLSLAAFLLLNGGLGSSNLGATGLITSMISSLLTVKVYKFFIDHKIVIKLPDSVPANVMNCFTALIPGIVILTTCWLIKAVLGFDLSNFLATFLTPFMSAADNILLFALCVGLHGLFWSVGMHFDNMIYNAVFGTFATVWCAANMTAKMAGEALPYIWTPGLYRISIVPAVFYPILILMLCSKLKQLRTLGIACTPSALFCITEPVTFSFCVFNPYMLVPMFLAGFAGGLITYGATLIGLLPCFFTELPWATPTFLYGVIGTGSWMGFVIQLVVIAVGVMIYLPFFKQYEANEMAKEKAAVCEQG